MPRIEFFRFRIYPALANPTISTPGIRFVSHVRIDVNRAWMATLVIVAKRTLIEILLKTNAFARLAFSMMDRVQLARCAPINAKLA
jgi:hypothetical protein